MIRFTTTLLQFAKQGEKTGWTYIKITVKLARQLKPNNRLGFRVKGKLDDHILKGVALMPMGDGSFIMPVNATMRKAIRKIKGAKVTVQLEEDKKPVPLDPDFLACLDDEPEAQAHFNTLTPGHRLYFSRWIESAKTEPTKTKRIAQAVNALAKGWGYPEMIRSQKKDREDLSM